MAQARYIEAVGGARASGRGVAARARADEPARDPAGAVPRARRRQHAGRARRDGLHHQRRAGKAARIRHVSERRSCRPSSTASSASAIERRSRDPPDATTRRPASGRRERPDDPAHRRARRDCRCSRSREVVAVPPALRRWTATPARRQRHPPGTAAAGRRRKIKATLYYVSEDGLSLVGVQREVPFGEPCSNRRGGLSRRSWQRRPRRCVSRSRRGPRCARCI